MEIDDLISRSALLDRLRGNVLVDVTTELEKAIQEQLKIGEWILCSERLPEEHDSMFAKLKGTNKWYKSMFEKISDNVTVTVIDDKGSSITTYAHTIDGQWSCDLLRWNKTFRVIAWQPLPEPYKPEK